MMEKSVDLAKRLSFALYYEYQKERVTVSPTARWLSELIVVVQVLGLILNASDFFPWGAISQVKPLTRVCGFLAVGPEMETLGGGAAVTLVVIAAVFTLGTMAASVYAASAIVLYSRHVHSLVKLSRLAMRLQSSILFVPLLTILLSPLTNVDGHMLGLAGAPTSWSAQHVVLVLVGVVSALMLLVQVGAACLFFVPYDSRCGDTFSRPHGRVCLAWRLILAAYAIVLSLHGEVSDWLVFISAAVFAAVYALLHLKLLPFYRVEANQFGAASGLMLCWAAGCLIFARLRHEKVSPDDEAAGFLWWLGVPFVLFTGYSMAQMRLSSIAAMPMQSASPYLVEIKCRMHMYAVMVWECKGGSLLSANGTEERGVDDDRKRAVAVEEVEAMYRRAVRENPSCGLLHRFFAHFQDAYKNSRTLELTHLGHAAKKHPSIDTSFFVYLRKRLIEDEEAASGAGNLSVAARITAERHRTESRRHATKARALQLRFWTQLLDPNPAIARLAQLAKRIDVEMTTADRHFRELIALNPQAVSVLRDYSQFLIEVANRPARAQALLEEADAIEDEQSKRHIERTKDVILFTTDVELDTASDKTSVVTISNEPETLGIIESVNGYFTKMFGYSRREAIKQNVSMIMPSPIADLHDHFLRKALDSGGDRMVSRSRIVFCQHAKGHVFPGVLHVRLLESAFGGMIQRIETPYRFILFVEKDWKIYATCLETHKALKITHETLSGSTPVPITRFLPEVEPIMQSELAALPHLVLSKLYAMQLRVGPGVEPIPVTVRFQRFPMGPNFPVLFVAQWQLGIAPSMAADLARPGGTMVLPDPATAVATAAAASPVGRETMPGGGSGAGAGAEDKSGWSHGSNAQLQPALAVGSDGRVHRAQQSPTIATSAASLPGPSGSVAAQSKQSDASLLLPPLLPGSGVSGSRQRVASKLSESASTGSNNVGGLVGSEDGDEDADHDAEADEREYDGDERKAGAEADAEDEGSASAAMSSGAKVRVTAVRMADVHADGGVVASRGLPGPRTVAQRGGRAAAAGRSVELATVAPRSTVDTVAVPAAGGGGGGGGGGGDRETDDDDEGDGLFDRASSLGSASSNQSSVMPKLRRSVDELDKSIDPGLSRLRRSFAWIFLAASILAIGSLVLVTSVNNAYLSDIHGLYDAGRRQYLLASMTVAVSQLVQVNRGLLPAALVNDTKDDLESFADEFFTLHQELYDSASSAAVKTLYTDPSVEVVDTEAGVEVTKKLTLLEAGVEYVKRAREVHDSTLESVTLVDTDVRFLLDNGPSTIATACNQSAQFAVETIVSNKESTRDLVLWEVCLVIAITELLSLLVVGPIVVRVLNTKDSVYQLFLDVPVQVLRELQRRTQAQMQRLVDGGDEGGGDLDEDGEREEEEGESEMDEEMGGAGGILKAARKSPGRADEKGATGQSSAARQLRRWKKSGVNRVVSRSIADRVLALIRFGGPLYFVAIFFSAMYFMEHTLDTNVHSTPDNVYESAQRYAMAQRFYYHAMRAVSAPLGNTERLSSEANHTMVLSDSIDFVNSALLYGSPYLGTSSIMDYASDIKTLHVANGCAGVATSRTPPCEEFEDGLFLNGLQAVLMELLRDGRVAVRQRLALQSSMNSTTYQPTITKMLSDMETLRLLNRYYLSDGLSATMTMLIDETRSRFQSVEALYTTITILGIFCLFVFFVVPYRRAVVALDREIKRTRAMLLLFPEDVILNVPSIRKLMRAIVSSLK